ncbi:hypothetical protein D3C76_1714900 [compost metagenome]
MCGCELCITHCIFFRKIRITIGDVSINGIREQEYILGRHADISTKFIKLQLPNINTVYEYAPFSYIVEARDEVDDCCFA